MFMFYANYVWGPLLSKGEEGECQNKKVNSKTFGIKIHRTNSFCCVLKIAPFGEASATLIYELIASNDDSHQIKQSTHNR